MHFDETVTLGNVLAGVSFSVMALFAWRDLTWRIKNLELWRAEHMVDSDARDQLMHKLDSVIELLQFQISLLMGKGGPGAPKAKPDD
jgi:hypothetical protein